MDAGQSTDSLATPEVASDLKAALEARRELGGELEEQVLEAFLVRVQHRIDAQVGEKLTQSGTKPPVVQRKGSVSGWVVPASIVLSFPLVGVAGMYAGVLGVLIVMVALVSLTAIWLDYAKS